MPTLRILCKLVARPCYGTASASYCHNKRGGVSNHQRRDCLLKPLFRRRSKETSKLRITGLCEGNSAVTGEFPAKRTSNAEKVFIWWRQHGNCLLRFYVVIRPYILTWCKYVHRMAPHSTSSVARTTLTFVNIEAPPFEKKIVIRKFVLLLDISANYADTISDERISPTFECANSTQHTRSAALWILSISCHIAVYPHKPF